MKNNGRKKKNDDNGNKETESMNTSSGIRPRLLSSSFLRPSHLFFSIKLIFFSIVLLIISATIEATERCLF